MVNYEKIFIDGIGNCLKISNEVMSFTVTCDIGPRVIELQLNEKKSVLFHDENDEFNGLNENYAVYGDLGTWHIYGGHRLWASPEETLRTAYPDNQPITVTEIVNGVKISGNMQVHNNIKAEMIIQFYSSNKLAVEHIITNSNSYPIEIAAWPITVMAYGGFAAVKMTDTQTGLLPNRTMSFWPYAKLNDERVYFGEKYLTLKADKDNETAFKFGLKTNAGYASYFTDDTLFVKRFEMQEGTYPDFGCNYESYTTKAMLEMESLSPLKIIGKNETISHSEVWELHELETAPDRKDEQAIDEILKTF